MEHVKLTVPEEHFKAVSDAVRALPGLGDVKAIYDRPQSTIEFDIEDADIPEVSSVLRLAARPID